MIKYECRSVSNTQQTWRRRENIEKQTMINADTHEIYMDGELVQVCNYRISKIIGVDDTISYFIYTKNGINNEINNGVNVIKIMEILNSNNMITATQLYDYWKNIVMTMYYKRDDYPLYIQVLSDNVLRKMLQRIKNEIENIMRI
jgi:hypothetical protein